MYVYIYNIIYLSSQFLCMVYLIEMYGGMCTFEQLIQLYIYFLKDKEEELESDCYLWRAAAGVQKKEEQKNKNNFLLLIGGA